MTLMKSNDDFDCSHNDGDDNHADGGDLHHGGEVVVPRLGREPLALPASGKQNLAMRMMTSKMVDIWQNNDNLANMKQHLAVKTMRILIM